MNDSSGQTIRIHVDEVSQLFNSLDPFPFHERDLDANAEEYIVGWALCASSGGVGEIRNHSSWLDQVRP